MNKKYYQKPAMEVMTFEELQFLLADSGSVQNLTGNTGFTNGGCGSGTGRSRYSSWDNEDWDDGDWDD